MTLKTLHEKHTQYSKIMSIFNKHIQTTVLSLNLCLEMVKMLSLNNLLPHISMQNIDNKIEVSLFTHGHHEDIT
jgi:hypothetical protein